MVAPALTAPCTGPVWWAGVWCAVLLLGSEWALSVIEAYAALTGSSETPAWVIPDWMFFTPIGLAVVFVLGCWVASPRVPAVARCGKEDVGIRNFKEVPSFGEAVTPIVRRGP